MKKVDTFSIICYYKGVKSTKDIYNSINDWKRENTKVYRIQCNKMNDADIIKILEGESNKSAFIKTCIREVTKATKEE